MSWESSAEDYRLASELVRHAAVACTSPTCAAVGRLHRHRAAAGPRPLGGRRSASGRRVHGGAGLLRRAPARLPRPGRARFPATGGSWPISSPRWQRGILFGCTEIDLLVDPADASVPVFDTTRLTSSGRSRSPRG